MEGKYKDMLQTLLLQGGSEDLNRDLELISFHFENAVDLQSEVKYLKVEKR